MYQPCLVTTLFEIDGKTQQCKLPNSKTCARCAARMCWQHIKLRCPQGRQTKYGVSQHMTAEHIAETRLAEGFTLVGVRIAKDPHLNQSARTVAITFGYRQSGSDDGTVIIYPGGVLKTPDRAGWMPDGDLANWLASTGRTQRGHLGEPESIVAQVKAALHEA